MLLKQPLILYLQASWNVDKLQYSIQKALNLHIRVENSNSIKKMAISLLPLCSVSTLLSLPSSSKYCIPNPSVSPNFSSIQLVHFPVVSRRKTCSATGKGNNADESASSFLDENGVVEDMDGYLNHLSLEYESVSTVDNYVKWCIHYLFKLAHSALNFSYRSRCYVDFSLVAYSAMIEERRKKVTSGIEDTMESNLMNASFLDDSLV
ncbi:hypothetical protein V2J09_004978 [Rumex salicifolius]